MSVLWYCWYLIGLFTHNAGNRLKHLNEASCSAPYDELEYLEEDLELDNVDMVYIQWHPQFMCNPQTYINWFCNIMCYCRALVDWMTTFIFQGDKISIAKWLTPELVGRLHDIIPMLVQVTCVLIDMDNGKTSIVWEA